MTSIYIIDTSVFLNLLDVPNCNQNVESVRQDFDVYTESKCTFYLPMATIIETGNHIAQNGDGRVRRKTAQHFVEQIMASFAGEAPWRPTAFWLKEDLLLWIKNFPDCAGSNKAPDRQEGTSFGDLSIIEEFHKSCKQFPMSEILIWSLDSDLQSYHQLPKS